MRTPAGKECQYFFGDYYRGRNTEECRLLNQARPPLRWKRHFCANCPVPGILLANACTSMVLKPDLYRPFPFLRQQVRVSAFCIKSNQTVSEPHIGCGECHQIPAVFSRESDDANAPA